MDGLLGVAGMIIDSSPVDHSRKSPTFSTSKIISYYKYLQYVGPPWNRWLSWAHVTPISRTGLWMFMVLLTTVSGVDKPTYNSGAPHCINHREVLSRWIEEAWRGFPFFRQSDVGRFALPGPGFLTVVVFNPYMNNTRPYLRPFTSYKYV